MTLNYFRRLITQTRKINKFALKGAWSVASSKNIDANEWAVILFVMKLCMVRYLAFDAKFFAGGERMR